MRYQAGFLYLADSYGNPVEIVNEARTAANMTAAINAGLPRFGDVQRNFGCDGLAYEPCTMAADGSVTSWNVLNTAATAAPWYAGASAALASEAIGFYIEDWTGLDGATHGRAVTQRGSFPYGGVPNVQGERERVMAINLIAIAKTERGLNFLSRWLEATLVANCGRCADTSLYYREHCPPGVSVSDLEDGLMRADQVALVEGPKWESEVIPQSACQLRRLSLTLVAGDPCLYRAPQTADKTSTITRNTSVLPVPAGYPALPGQWVGTTARVVKTVPFYGYGQTSAYVLLRTSDIGTAAGVRETLPAIRITGYLTNLDATVTQPAFQKRVGEIIVDGLTSGEELEINLSTGRARMRDMYNARDWIDGSSYVMDSRIYDPTCDVPRAIAFSGCDQGALVIEPALSGSTSEYYVTNYRNITRVDVTFFNKIGCR